MPQKVENKNFTSLGLDSLSVLNKRLGLNHLLVIAILLNVKKEVPFTIHYFVYRLR